MLDGIVDEVPDVLECLARNDRAVRHRLVEAVADLVGADDFLEFFDKLVVDGVLHEDAVGADACLARIAVLGCGSTLCGELEIGIFEDDDRRITAKLHRQALERICALLRQQLADGRRTRESQLANDRVAAQFVANRFGVLRRQDVEQTRRQAGAVGEFRLREHRQRRFVRRLGNHRAADCKRRGNLACQHRRREVPRRNGRADADRLLDNDASATRLRQRQHVTVNTLALFSKPLDE